MGGIKLILLFAQVNRSPSFGTDSQLDLDIKSGVIKDALKIINIQLVLAMCFAQSHMYILMLIFLLLCPN